ncbi:sulfur oxygenase reductase family protein [Novosphingobium sp. ZN18A2]|uniref:sulfur oxygenase reductase family protein n=1 Tax=Novosphingobium sp. ZN18A2 TaxID=3079861 RepID=UPI0030D61240
MPRGMKNGVAIAINQTSIVNRPESFAQMQKVGPRVCITTANSPDFLGFYALIEVGSHPVGGRFGGAKVVNADSLQAIMDDPSAININPLKLWQYTVWNNPDAHEKMHAENFERIFELCSDCLTMVVEGPQEPVFEVVASDMPPIDAMVDLPAQMGAAFAKQQPVPKARLQLQRLVAIGEHKLKKGTEAEFEKGVVATLNTLKKEAPGMIGWMVMKRLGEAALGPLQFGPKEVWQSLETLGANPPDEPRTVCGIYGKDYDGVAIPHEGYPEYYVHTEWQDPTALMFGLSLPAVNPEIRKIHDEGVMEHLVSSPPYYRVFAPMMEDMIAFH